MSRLNVEPFAEQWDRDQRIPDSVISKLAQSGYLGCSLPPDYGGQGWDIVTFGLLNEALGRGSSALTGVLTVQAMVSMALLKWGTTEQKRKWLPPLARGEMIGAFALTEPGAGSAIESLTTEFTRDPTGDRLILNGHKKWISCAQFADGVSGVWEARATVRSRAWCPGTLPVFASNLSRDLMGFRAAGLARAPLRRRGSAISQPRRQTWFRAVARRAGRLALRKNQHGLLGAGTSERMFRRKHRLRGHAEDRRQDRGRHRDDPIVDCQNGHRFGGRRVSCATAPAARKTIIFPKPLKRRLMAKYFTSRAAVRAASDAVQIRGASGCHGSSAGVALLP